MEDPKKERYRVTVEPILLVIGFCASFAESVKTELYLRQYCSLYEYGSLQECKSNRNHYNEVQEAVSVLIAASQWLANLGPAIIGFFAGPWSDTNGRKPFLIIGIASQLAYWALFAMMASSNSIYPYFLLAPSFIWLIAGGQPLSSVMSLCYVVDVTTEQNRSFRLGIALSLEYAVMLVTSLLSPLVFNNGSYWGFIMIFGINSVLLLLSLFYIIFYLPETVSVKKENKEKFFTAKHAIAIYKAITKKRLFNLRSILLLLIIADILSYIFTMGESQTKYLAVTLALDWDLARFNFWTSVTLALSFIGTVAYLGIFSKWMGITDAPLLAGAFGLKAVSSIIQALARSEAALYIGSAVGCTSLVPVIMNKSMATKSVDKEESGVIMVLMTMLNSAVVMVSSTLYSAVYNACVSSSPLAFFFTSTVISGIGFLITLIIMFLSCRAGQGSHVPEHVSDGNSVAIETIKSDKVDS